MQELRVTKREYKMWIGWLKKQGYSGPFAGLSTRHECVRRLYKELKKDPPTILETRQRDARTIVANLDKYGRKKRSPPSDNTDDVGVDSTSISQRPPREHWERLARLAETLKLGLNFRNQNVFDTARSRCGDLIMETWYLSRSKKVHFGVQEEELWSSLMEHLDYEYESPRFSEQFNAFIQLASDMIENNNGDPGEARRHPLARELQRELTLVIERGTFKGICTICENTTDL